MTNAFVKIAGRIAVLGVLGFALLISIIRSRNI